MLKLAIAVAILLPIVTGQIVCNGSTKNGFQEPHLLSGGEEDYYNHSKIQNQAGKSRTYGVADIHHDDLPASNCSFLKNGNNVFLKEDFCDGDINCLNDCMALISDYATWAAGGPSRAPLPAPAPQNLGERITCMHAGKILNGNTTLFLNAGDSLMVKCRAFGKDPIIGLDDDQVPGFIITKNAAPNQVRVILSLGGFESVLAVDKGDLIYDTINGNSCGNDHYIVRSHLPIYTNTLYASGTILMYIPALVPLDAGIYYVSFMDGSTSTNIENTNALQVSYSITLQINTKSGATKQMKLLSNISFFILTALQVFYLLN